MPDLYEPGEFSLADKLLPTEHRAARLAVLQRLYKRDPRLAQEVISYAWPNERHRPYTDQELRQRLAIKARAALNTKVGAELFDELFPSVSAAYDAYEMERQRQAAIEAQNYPAMNFTQPMMASYALGASMGADPGGGMTQPPVHHRRHYHRHHKVAQTESEKVEKAWNKLTEEQREKIRLEAKKILQPSTDATLDEQLAAKLLHGAGVNHAIHDKWNIAGGGGWSSKDNSLYFTPQASKNPHVVAHEVGHSQLEKMPYQRLAQSTASGMGFMLGPLFGVHMGAVPATPAGRVAMSVAWPLLTQGPRLYAEHKAWDLGRERFQAAAPSEAQRAEFEKTRDAALKTYHNVAAITLGTTLLGAGVRTGVDAWLRHKGQRR